MSKDSIAMGEEEQADALNEQLDGWVNSEEEAEKRLSELGIEADSGSDEDRENPEEGSKGNDGAWNEGSGSDDDMWEDDGSEEEEEEEWDFDQALFESIIDGNQLALFDAISTSNMNVLEKLDDYSEGIEDMVSTKDSQGRTALHLAALVGHELWTCYLLDQGSPVESMDFEGRSPLHLAALKHGNWALMDRILMSNANVDPVDFLKRTPLHLACIVGNVDCAQTLVFQGADYNAKDASGLTPLHMACLNCHYYAASFLLEPFASGDEDSESDEDVNDDSDEEGGDDSDEKGKGADVHARDSGGRTALHAVASSCVSPEHTNIVKLLLANGVPVDVTDNKGRTPLFHAIAGTCHLDCVNVLIAQGADPQAKDDNGCQPMHYAAYFARRRCIVILAQNDASLDCVDNRGRTPLHAGVGSEEIVGMIIESASNPLQCDKDGRTAMHVAMIGGCTDSFITMTMVTPGVDVNATDRFGRTYLHYCAMNNDMESLERLLEMHADPCKKDASGQNPIHVAAKYGSLSFIKMIKETVRQHKVSGCISGSDVRGRKPLHRAAAYGHIDVIAYLLDNRAQVWSPDKLGASALQYASYFGRDQCAELLAAYGQVNRPDKIGDTPLHAAASGGSIECAKVLLESEADINLLDVQGRPPVFFASDMEVRAFFLENGSNPAVKVDKLGRSALHSAAQLNKLHVLMEILKEDDCDVSLADVHGVTPLHLAAANGLVSGAKLLVQAGASVSTQDKQGRNSCYYAAASGQHQCLVELMKLDAEAIKMRDEKGRTALDAACFGGHEACAQEILGYLSEADLEPANDGRSPLHAACFRPKESTHLFLAMLVEVFDVNGVDKSGRGALHRVAAAGNAECAEVLLVAGADVDCQDDQGITPLMLACHLGEAEVAEVLHEHDASNDLKDNQGRSAASFESRRAEKLAAEEEDEEYDDFITHESDEDEESEGSSANEDSSDDSGFADHLAMPNASDIHDEEESVLSASSGPMETLSDDDQAAGSAEDDLEQDVRGVEQKFASQDVEDEDVQPRLGAEDSVDVGTNNDSSTDIAGDNEIDSVIHPQLVEVANMADNEGSSGSEREAKTDAFGLHEQEEPEEQDEVDEPDNDAEESDPAGTLKLRSQLADLTAKFDRLQGDFDHLQSEYDDVVREKEVANATCDVMKTETEALKKTVAGLEEENDRQRNELAEAASQFDARSAEVAVSATTALKAEVEAARTTLETTTTSLAAITKRFEEESAAHLDTRKEVVAKEAEAIALQEKLKLAADNDQVSDLLAANETLKASLQEKDNRIKQLELQATASTEELRDLEDKLVIAKERSAAPVVANEEALAAATAAHNETLMVLRKKLFAALALGLKLDMAFKGVNVNSTLDISSISGLGLEPDDWGSWIRDQYEAEATGKSEQVRGAQRSRKQ